MAENLVVAQGTKTDKYITLVAQVEALILGEPNVVANMANISSAIQMTFGYLWVGFYVVVQTELVLGPFQGPIACTRIGFGKGVCGTAWAQEKTIIVPNVNEFPGHIACSSASVSEIVVPVRNKSGKIIAVLDVDSIHENDFDEVDERFLSQIVDLLTTQTDRNEN
jgi:GAF domain-containing protein